LLHENSRPQSHVGIVGSTPPTGVTRSEDSRRLRQNEEGKPRLPGPAFLSIRVDRG